MWHPAVICSTIRERSGSVPVFERRKSKGRSEKRMPTTALAVQVLEFIGRRCRITCLYIMFAESARWCDRETHDDGCVAGTEATTGGATRGRGRKHAGQHLLWHRPHCRGLPGTHRPAGACKSGMSDLLRALHSGGICTPRSWQIRRDDADCGCRHEMLLGWLGRRGAGCSERAALQRWRLQ